MSDHSKKAWILLFAWMLTVGAILLAVWFALHGPLDGLGWMMAVILGGGAIALISVFLTALIVGLATRTAFASVFGAICGVPVAFFVVSLVNAIQDHPAKIQLQQERAEINALANIAKREDRTEIAAGLADLKNFSMPEAICIFLVLSTRYILATRCVSCRIDYRSCDPKNNGDGRRGAKWIAARLRADRYWYANQGVSCCCQTEEANGRAPGAS